MGIATLRQHHAAQAAAAAAAPPAPAPYVPREEHDKAIRAATREARQRIADLEAALAAARQEVNERDARIADLEAIAAAGAGGAGGDEPPGDEPRKGRRR